MSAVKQNEEEEKEEKERVYQMKVIMNADNKEQFCDCIYQMKVYEMEEYVEDITEELTEEEVCEKMNEWISHYLKLKHKQSSKDIFNKVSKMKSKQVLSPDKEQDLFKTMFKVSDNFDRSSLINHLTEFINTYTF